MQYTEVEYSASIYWHWHLVGLGIYSVSLSWVVNSPWCQLHGLFFLHCRKWGQNHCLSTEVPHDISKFAIIYALLCLWKGGIYTVLTRLTFRAPHCGYRIVIAIWSSPCPPAAVSHSTTNTAFIQTLLSPFTRQGLQIVRARIRKGLVVGAKICTCNKQFHQLHSRLATSPLIRVNNMCV